MITNSERPQLRVSQMFLLLLKTLPTVKFMTAVALTRESWRP